MTWLTLLDLAGVFVFALTGALAAARKNMDIFGYCVLALLPAVGGGTVRDLVLDVPVFWVQDSTYVLVAIAAAILVYVQPVRVGLRLRWIAWADAVGLALFCVLGASKALQVADDVTVAVTLGVVTAVVGGILRDVVSNEIPLILQREVYATAAMLGSAVYCSLFLLSGEHEIGLIAGGACAFALRALALRFSWSLPNRGGQA